jgi:hypothetical protein
MVAVSAWTVSRRLACSDAIAVISRETEADKEDAASVAMAEASATWLVRASTCFFCVSAPL